MRISDRESIVMPFAVTDLWYRPSPLRGLKLVEGTDLTRFLAQKEHQSAVVYEHSVVMSVHSW